MLKEPPSPQIARMLWSLLPYLPLGLLAGLLSGLLGIGGGLVFAPMLLLAGLEPHQALATSTLAIVPTTLGSTWTHLANRSLPWRPALAIAITATPSSLCMLLGGAGLPGERYLYWNFVSSRKHRIEQAKQDWRQGRFAAVPGDETEFIPLPDKAKTVSYP